MTHRTSQEKGFTLLEILIVIALIAILIGIVIAALNPARQFANARNSTRHAHLNTLMNGVSSNMAENNGVFTCATGTVPSSATAMADTTSVPGAYNIAPCLVPNFLTSMPYDPSATGAHYTSVTDYSTGYTILLNAAGNLIVNAPAAELGQTISLTR